MEGGMTRRRGYVWLCVLLLGVATGLVVAQPKGSDPWLSPTSVCPVVPGPEVAVAAQPHPAPSGWAPCSNGEGRGLMFELNTADSLDLVQLYNIGPTIARRILRYRSLLGGYVRVGQLREVYGIDSARFADIAPHLTVNPELISRLDINSATVDELKRHPYLDYYVAKAVVRRREVRGPYEQVEDLLDITIMDTQIFKRIEPYLTCNLQPKN